MNTLTPTRLLRSVHHCPRRTAYSLLGSKVKREKLGELSPLVPSEGPVPGSWDSFYGTALGSNSIKELNLTNCGQLFRKRWG